MGEIGLNRWKIWKASQIKIDTLNRIKQQAENETNPLRQSN